MEGFRAISIIHRVCTHTRLNARRRGPWYNSGAERALRRVLRGSPNRVCAMGASMSSSQSHPLELSQ